MITDAVVRFFEVPWIRANGASCLSSSLNSGLEISFGVPVVVVELAADSTHVVLDLGWKWSAVLPTKDWTRELGYEEKGASEMSVQMGFL